MISYFKDKPVIVEPTTLVEYIFNHCFDIDDLRDYLTDDCASAEEMDEIENLPEDFLEELHCKLNDELNRMCWK